MPEGRLDTLGRSKAANSAPNALDPSLMSTGERLEEVASLLALGFLRHRLRAAKRREKPLAIPGEPSDSCSKPRPRGEKDG